MPSGHSGEPRAGLPACTWNGLTGWTADGARGGLDFPSSRMQVRTRTVQCTQVLAELPIANCRGLGVREGGKEHRAETSPCITFWAPAQLPQGYLPYPAVPGSSHTHRRGPSRLGRHGLSTRPSTHATGTAASFPQACRLSLAAHVRKHVQAPSSAAFRHEQSSTQSPAVSPLCSTTAANCMPAGLFLLSSANAPVPLRGQSHQNQRRKNTHHRFDK